MKGTKQSECLFLERLPVELRLNIYEYLLHFDRPIKLLQVVPGPRNLAILRTNRQIYEEALSVLYDLNTVTVTRNDFCKYTDPTLKTPLKLDHARHLLMAIFYPSIACTVSGPEQQCDVCQPSAMGLILAFKSMPRLQTVLVEHSRHPTEMRLFKEQLPADEGLRIETLPSGIGSEIYSLRGPAVEGMHIQFVNGLGSLGLANFL